MTERKMIQAIHRIKERRKNQAQTTLSVCIAKLEEADAKLALLQEEASSYSSYLYNKQNELYDALQASIASTSDISILRQKISAMRAEESSRYQKVAEMSEQREDIIKEIEQARSRLFQAERDVEKMAAAVAEVDAEELRNERLLQDAVLEEFSQFPKQN